ncbi:MAG: RluA family pseudouridine synthase [Actinobacteria bacterium]|nr:RluA family pseudouridine synthase [Actinomycetota bacterium]NDE12428.1 RluA family pseudouridine synthase [Actinomycetota bacterium]NDE83626.1 RluA family pseudouridine synthase [Actinomycetota bacterium]
MSEREKRSLQIESEYEGERVDVALAALLGISRSAVADLLNAGEVLQGKKPLVKSDRLRAGDRIQVLMPAAIDPLDFTRVVSEELNVVYDDADVVVVNKPVGVAAHPSPGWQGPTVLGDLISKGYRISTSGSEERKGIVQRLDVGTTGLMVVAKHEDSYIALKNQFRVRTVTKVYHALVQGHMDPAEGTIDAPIGRHPKEDYRFAVVADGKASITHFSLIEFFPGATLLKVELETGRTHQIRVHFSALRHPLVGDLAYGSDPVLASKLELKRPWLHAMELAFDQPSTGERVKLEAPYPDDLKRALALLGSKS